MCAQPGVPLGRADGERGVPHPQPRVAALLGVGRRAAPVLLEEAAQPGLGAVPVVLRVQRREHRVGRGRRRRSARRGRGRPARRRPRRRRCAPRAGTGSTRSCPRWSLSGGRRRPCDPAYAGRRRSAGATASRPEPAGQRDARRSADSRSAPSPASDAPMRLDAVEPAHRDAEGAAAVGAAARPARTTTLSGISHEAPSPDTNSRPTTSGERRARPGRPRTATSPAGEDGRQRQDDERGTRAARAGPARTSRATTRPPTVDPERVGGEQDADRGRPAAELLDQRGGHALGGVGEQRARPTARP